MERKDCIGSTCAPAVMGTSKHKGPHDVFLQSMGVVKPATEYMEVSLVDEASHTTLMARKLAALGRPAEFKECPTYFHVEDGVNLRASPDRKSVISRRHSRPVYLVELKNCYWADRGEYGEEFSSDVPPGYRDQCIWHMGVAKLNNHEVENTLLSCRFKIGHYPEFFFVPRDDERFAWMMAECVDFWHRYVETKTPPPADSSGECRKAQALAREWEDKTREVTTAERAKLRDVFKKTAGIAKLDDEIDLLKNQLLEGADGHERLTLNGKRIVSFTANKNGARSLRTNLKGVEL